MRILGFVGAIGFCAVAGAGLLWALESETGATPTTIAEADGWRFPTPPTQDNALDGCVACHRLTPQGAERSAPALWRIVGAPVARAEWFGYSPALAIVGGNWDRAALDRYLSGPMAAVPGTFKTLPPLLEATERARMIDALAALR